MRRWWLLLAGLLLLAGCGDDAESEPAAGQGLRGVVVDVHFDPG